MERRVTFDFGPEGSLTEDLFFQCRAFDLGFRFGWIEGVMREQAAFTFQDFFKQRRRWILVRYHQQQYACKGLFYN